MRLRISLALLIAFIGIAAGAQTVVYVANERLFNGTALTDLSIIDAATNTITGSVTVGPRPHQVIASPDGSRVYVSYLPSTFSRGVAAIDTVTNTVVGTLNVPVFSYMAISPDGSRLYAVDEAATINANGTGVNVIDTASMTIVATITPPGVTLPRGIAASPDGTKVYLADAHNGTIFIIDTATNTIVDSIPEFPCGVCNGSDVGTTSLAISPDGTRLYAVHGGLQGLLTAYDTATKTPLTTTFGGASIFIDLTPNGTKGYTFGPVDVGPYTTFDTATLATNSVAPIGKAWVQASFTPDGATAYITDLLNGTVNVFDVATDNLITVIQLWTTTRLNPWGVAVVTPPPVTLFSAFNVAKLDVKNGFQEKGGFTVAAASSIDLATQAVTLTIGSYVLTIPAGSYDLKGKKNWELNADVAGVHVKSHIKAHGNSDRDFDYDFDVKGAALPNTRPINVSLKIGRNIGSAVVQ